MKVVTLEGFTPPARFDGLPWTHLRMEGPAASADGPWVAIETVPLVPLDADPKDPASRSMTTALALDDVGWFRVVFVDGAGLEVESGAVYSSPELFASLGRTMGELVDELLEIAGLDVEPERALAWLNDRHAEMVAKARALKQRLALGVTDGGASIVAPNVVELYELKIGGSSYKRVRRQDMEKARAQQLRISWPGLIFSSEANVGGNATFEIYPGPAADQEIEVFAAMRPPNLGRGDRTMVPRERERALIEGAFATGLAFDTEQLGAADRFEGRFDLACAELYREVKRQFRGSGPSQILLHGVNG